MLYLCGNAQRQRAGQLQRAALDPEQPGKGAFQSAPAAWKPPLLERKNRGRLFHKAQRLLQKCKAPLATCTLNMKKLFGNVASVLGSLLVILTLANAAELKEAHVTQVVSDVKLLPQQAAPRPATVNDPVRKGTAVRTGPRSRSELTFNDLTITRLGANTIFSFEEGTRMMDLRDGAILFQVPKGSGGATIRTTAVQLRLPAHRDRRISSCDEQSAAPDQQVALFGRNLPPYFA